MRSNPISTLAEVASALENVELAQARRRDLLSAVARTAEIVGSPPEAVPLDLPMLAAALNTARANGVRVSPKTVANIRSGLSAAVRLAGIGKRPAEARPPLTPTWQTFIDALPDRALRTGLSRFSRWCSAHGVDPADVSDAVMRQFDTDLRDSLVRKPTAAFAVAVRSWNMAHAILPAAPGSTVSPVRNGRAPTRFPLEKLPESFRKDLEAYLAWAGSSDTFDEQARGKALGPNTVRLRRDQIHTAVDVAVADGIEAHRLKTLTDLVSVDVVKAVFGGLWQRQGGEAYAVGVGITLVSIAREWARVDDRHLAEIKKLRRKLKAVTPGLTKKNKRTLQNLDDPSVLGKLLDLPAKLWAVAKSDKCPPTRRLPTYQIAILLRLLQHAPVRMNNAISLTLGRHLTFPFGRNDKAVLSYSADETKNGMPFECELTGDLARMLHQYATQVLPKFTGKPCRELFVTATGRRKTAAAMSAHFRDTIEQHLGFPITPHQMRHATAKIVLDAHPGAMALVSQLLGHKNGKTTVNFYAGLEATRATRALDEVIQRARAQAPASRRSGARGR